MIAKAHSFGIMGIEAYPVEIDVDVSWGLPRITLIGLADAAIKESKERVKTAIKNSGFNWPAQRVTISLAPSYLKKEGTYFDLAIALAVLASSGQLDAQRLKDYFILAELSLDGTIRPTRGILPAAIASAGSRIKNIIVAAQNAEEAAVVPNNNIFALKTLRQAVEFIHNPQTLTPVTINTEALFRQNAYYPIDFSEVKSQYLAKRAIEIACAGGHNILMIGPPGSGKTMLAKRIPTIMPGIGLKESLEVTKIHSAAGELLRDKAFIATRPFRNPHHTISSVALSGGGTMPSPGEISLAHQGVLFLDELPEFRRDCLEALRQPLEEGSIRICRAAKSMTFPASFMLVGAMNPCPCGMFGQHKSTCRCNGSQIARYRAKISGPLLDRIDIHIDVPAVKYQDLTCLTQAESSAQIKQRVENAREIQQKRFLETDEKILCNSQMSHKQVRKFCALGEKENELLKKAMTELNLSARAYDKILKISRTIADLAGEENITTEHLSEAIQYRSLDREFFV